MRKTCTCGRPMFWESETLTVSFPFKLQDSDAIPQIISGWCVWLSGTIPWHGCQISSLGPQTVQYTLALVWDHYTDLLASHPLPSVAQQTNSVVLRYQASCRGCRSDISKCSSRVALVMLMQCSLIRPSCQTWVWTCIMSLLLQHVNLPDILYYVMALKTGPVIYRGKLTWSSAWCHEALPVRLPVCCYFIALQLCDFRKTLLQDSHLCEILIENLVVPLENHSYNACLVTVICYCYYAVVFLRPCMIIVFTFAISKIPASFLANYFLLE